MKLSTKGRYAVTAMLDLAIHEGSGPVTLADISRCQGISLSYLEQLFARLRRRRLVRGVRGPGGGYRLARGANSITVAEVIAAVPHLGGNIFHDAQTAILMREHGVGRIYTRDTDFHRFPFLQAIDPVA